MEQSKQKRVSRTYRLNPVTVSLLKQVKKATSLDTDTKIVETAIIDFCDYWLSRIAENKPYNESAVNN